MKKENEFNFFQSELEQEYFVLANNLQTLGRKFLDGTINLTGTRKLIETIFDIRPVINNLIRKYEDDEKIVNNLLDMIIEIKRLEKSICIELDMDFI